MNEDGTLNVIDIIEIVNIILGNRGIDANWSKLLNDGRSVQLKSDGVIGGVQMILEHSDNFSIQLTDNALVADYKTTAKKTTLVIVAPTSEELFTYTGDFELTNVLVASSKGEIPVIPATHKLKVSAYPNPYNPVTSINFEIFENGFTEVMIYDLNGQFVTELMKGEINKGQYQIPWDATAYPSGIYLARVTSVGISETIKLMMIK